MEKWREDKFRKAMEKRRRDLSGNGIGKRGSALERSRKVKQWHRIANISCGKAVLGKVKDMNGQESLWKSYEGRLFATEMPLKQL